MCRWRRWAWPCWACTSWANRSLSNGLCGARGSWTPARQERRGCMTVNPVRVLPFSLLAVIACSGGSNPHVTTCTTAGDTVTLAAWQYASIDPAGGNGCTVYPAAGGSGAQYFLEIGRASCRERG